MDNINYIETLISKFLSGEASPEEAMQLEDWKLQDPKNLEQFEKSQKLFHLLKSHHQIKPNIDIAWQRVQSEINTEPKIIALFKNYKTFIGVAASLVLLVSTYFLIKKQNGNTQLQTITLTAQNKVKNIALLDHSTINLSPGASLVYDQNFGKTNRKVVLKGSAYFTVKHKEEMPFIVDLGNVFVKDLGTKFYIKLSADSDSIHLKVDEGIVLLFDSASNAIEIKASERALYIKSTKQLLNNDALLKKELYLNFDKTPLSIVAVQLEEKFGVKIIYTNPKLNNCVISAKFKEEDLDTIIAIITETLGLSYKKENVGYIINGESCN
jgi:ferric-dicitrate binding protein FerR (iron transport regulator)